MCIFKSAWTAYKLESFTVDSIGPNQSLEEIPQYEFSIMISVNMPGGRLGGTECAQSINRIFRSWRLLVLI